MTLDQVNAILKQEYPGFTGLHPVNGTIDCMGKLNGKEIWIREYGHLYQRGEFSVINELRRQLAEDQDGSGTGSRILPDGL